MSNADQIHPAGPFPSIRPVECAPWCTDGDGHTGASSREDQNCWGESHYVELSIEEVDVEVDKDSPTGHTIWPSFIGPNAYRGYRQQPCVYLHLMLQGHGDDGLLDDSVKLTVEEARQLAHGLIAVADEIIEGELGAAGKCVLCAGAGRVRLSTGRWNYTRPCPDCDPEAFAAAEVDPDHVIIGPDS